MSRPSDPGRPSVISSLAITSVLVSVLYNAVTVCFYCHITRLSTFYVMHSGSAVFPVTFMVLCVRFSNVVTFTTATLDRIG